MASGFTTIGHSNRPLEEFVEMLRGARVDLVLDVRSFPRSRSNPAFNIEVLPAHLRRRQMGYRHCPALGGRRPRQPDVDPALNALWRVQSFHNYADYALSEAFGDAFKTVVALGAKRRVALMCAEAVWWRCHRRIITDYLLYHGSDVDHLMGLEQTDKATPTPGSRPFEPSNVIYPAEVEVA